MKIQIPASAEVFSVVDFYVPDVTPSGDQGEGKSGFIKESTADPYSQKEIALLFQGLGPMLLPRAVWRVRI